MLGLALPSAEQEQPEECGKRIRQRYGEYQKAQRRRSGSSSQPWAS
jgi:hypothetical protein